MKTFLYGLLWVFVVALVVIGAFNIYSFIQHGHWYNLLVGLWDFVVAIFIAPKSPKKKHQLKSIEARREYLDLLGDKVRDDYSKRLLYLETRIESCQLQMAWLRYHRYTRSWSDKIFARVFRCEFPTKERYAESRQFWLEQIDFWKSAHKKYSTWNW